MKKPLLVPGLVALLVSCLGASVPACNPSSADPDAAGGDSGGGSDSSNSSGGDGSAGSPDAAGGTAASGPSGDAGQPGSAGSPGDGGGPDGGSGPGGGSGDALPASTFLYVYSETADRDLLVARDWSTGEERVVTDLRADGSDGWEIWGHAISPDRRRIAVASLFGPADADTATHLATRRLWTFATDGSDFQRLTPVFENTGGGRTNFEITVQDPAFTADGSGVIYDFGNWWYEGTSLKGGSTPWLASTSGDLPAPFPTITSCSVLDPSINPATGEVLLIHSVCVNADDEGIFLYPPGGGTEPTKLVNKGYGPGAVDPALTRASWLADGSEFLFVGNIEVMRGAQTETVSSLLVFDMATGDIGVLLTPDAGTNVRNATVAPDGSGIVYCLAHDGGYDLHAIDLTLDPPEDAAITGDGKSCDPAF